MNTKQAILKALILNKEGKLKEPIILTCATDFTDMFYNSEENILSFNKEKERTLLHEGAHAIFELYYNNTSNAYLASDLEKNKQFDIAAKKTILNILEFLDKEDLTTIEVDQSLKFEKILFSLKQDPIISSFWMSHISTIAQQKFDSFWGYKNFILSQQNFDDSGRGHEISTSNTRLACKDYPWIKELVPTKELPFTNPCDFYMKLQNYLDICPGLTNINFLQPSQLLFTSAKNIATNAYKKINYKQKDFIESFSTLIYYPEDEYSYELIARIIEFSNYDTKISAIIAPLESFLEEFVHEINNLYQNNFGDTIAELSVLGCNSD